MKAALLLLLMSFFISCSSHQKKSRSSICVLTLYYKGWSGELITQASEVSPKKDLPLKGAIFHKPRTPDMGAGVKSLETEGLPKELRGITLLLEHSRKKFAGEEVLSIQVALWEDGKKLMGPVESMVTRKIPENYLGHQSSPLLRFQHEHKDQPLEVLFRCN